MDVFIGFRLAKIPINKFDDYLCFFYRLIDRNLCNIVIMFLLLLLILFLSLCELQHKIHVVQDSSSNLFALDIETSLGTIGQHQCYRSIIDPNQFCQTHRIETCNIRYWSGGIAFYASCL